MRQTSKKIIPTLMEVKCVVVGPQSYAKAIDVDPITKQFTKDLRNNGIRIAGYDFTRWAGRGIFVLPYTPWKTTRLLRDLSIVQDACVFCLYGEDVRCYKEWILTDEPKRHRVFIDSAPYREFDFQL